MSTATPIYLRSIFLSEIRKCTYFSQYYLLFPLEAPIFPTKSAKAYPMPRPTLCICMGFRRMFSQLLKLGYNWGWVTVLLELIAYKTKFSIKHMHVPGIYYVDLYACCLLTSEVEYNCNDIAGMQFNTLN